MPRILFPFVVAVGLAASLFAQEPNAALRTQDIRLSSEAAEVAGEIKIGPLLKKIAEQRATGSTITLESLDARQQVTERISAASLDVDSVNAVIGFEMEHVRAARSKLQVRRDKAQNIVNIASIFGGGVLGAVGTAMQFNSKTAALGNGIIVGGGAGSVILSLIGLHQQGGTSDLGDSPRILSRFSGREPAAAEAVSSVFPSDVWAYLNAPSPTDPGGKTRRQQLMDKWQKEGKTDENGLLKSERKLKAAGLVQAPKLSISEMDDVQAMLLDIIASVSLMKRDLSEILYSLSESPR
jgi:hypothetical protein